MRFAILFLPRYLHLKRLIFEELARLDHSFVVFEQRQREHIDGGMAAIEHPRNIDVVMLDDTSYDPLAEAVATRRIDRVISFSDRGVVLAARLRERFAMGGNRVDSELCVVDKARMRDRLHRAGLSHIRFRPTTLDRIADDITALPGPVVVKPTSLGASICVELITDHRAVPAYVSRCRANRVLQEPELLIEEYMPGEEFSVEGIVVAGEPSFFGITRSHTSGAPYFVGSGHDFMTGHPDSDRIYRFIGDVIRCLGLHSCPFHIEVKRVPGGFEIVEAHSRFAGAMIMELVRCATGIPVFAHSVETLAGKPAARPRASDGLVYSQHLLCTEPGVVEAIALDPEVSSDPRVISFALDVAPGGVIESNVVPVEYAGYINFTSRDLDDADRFRARVDRAFHLELAAQADGAR